MSAPSEPNASALSDEAFHRAFIEPLLNEALLLCKGRAIAAFIVVEMGCDGNICAHKREHDEMPPEHRTRFSKYVNPEIASTQLLLGCAIARGSADIIVL